MGTRDNCDMNNFQHRGSDRTLNCPMITNPMFKSSNGVDPFFGSGWDPLVSLGHSENMGGSMVVSNNELASPNYSVVLQNQTIATPSYPSDSGLVEMVTKLHCFGSGSLSEMVNSFGLVDTGQITATSEPPDYSHNKVRGAGNANTSRNGLHSQECQVSEEEPAAASHNMKRKRRVSESQSPLNSNQIALGDQLKDPSRDSSEPLKEQTDKKKKVEQNLSANMRCKQTGKQVKENSNSGEAPKEDYIHVRARRGQATNSHSLAERVRRERISERMRLLQELVPGCNKITGKAVMLDEIINYVQSLQQQVEFLSMKLATVNPELNVDIDRILSKDVLQSRGTSAPTVGFGPGLSSPHQYPQGITQESLCGIPSTTPRFHSMPQNLWEGELQTLLQMGFESNSAVNNLGSNGHSKPEL